MELASVGCKVNWTLEVLGRRADGFHELRSWFIWLELGDRLTARSLATASNSCLLLTGPYTKGVPNDSSNLVLRAEAAWRAAGGLAAAQEWSLHKRLPPGSGLGAGSADAAAALRHLQAIADTPLQSERLLEVAGELGSDIPFFLGNAQAALMLGRGEVCAATASAAMNYFLVAIPPVSCPTPLVYQQLQASPLTENHDPDLDRHAKQRPPTEPGRNGLEQAACLAVPELAEWGRRLNAAGPFQLSGSGSAWFAACPDLEKAEEIAAQVRAWGLPVWITQPKLTP